MSNLMTVYKSIDRLVDGDLANYFSLALKSTGHSPDLWKQSTMLELGIHLSDSRNSRLLQCTPNSFLSALKKAAVEGLTLNEHFYLVPFGDRATYMISYKGIIELYSRQGIIIRPYLVYQGDVFRLQYGLSPDLHHIPTFQDPDESYTSVTHAYAVAHMAGKDPIFTVLSKKQLDKKRLSSKSQKFWVEYPHQMALKSAVRELTKYLPKSIAIQKQAALEMEAEPVITRGGTIDIEFTEPPTTVEQLTNGIDAKQNSKDSMKHELGESTSGNNENEPGIIAPTKRKRRTSRKKKDTAAPMTEDTPPFIGDPPQIEDTEIIEEEDLPMSLRTTEEPPTISDPIKVQPEQNLDPKALRQEFIDDLFKEMKKSGIGTPRAKKYIEEYYQANLGDVQTGSLRSYKSNRYWLKQMENEQ